VQVLQVQAKQNADRLELIHTQLDEKVSALHDHLQEMLMALQRTEELLQNRLAAVEERVSARVKQMTQDSRSASDAWIAPFVLLVGTVSIRGAVGCHVVRTIQVVGVTGIGAWVWSKYRHLQKTHML
jgi:hypothetical protein